jgi:hypothetical protein
MTLSEQASIQPPMQAGAGTPDKSLDRKILGQAIIELNIARKNFSIYPSGHSQLERSIDRAHNVLNRLLETAPELTLGVAKDCLFMGDSYLDRKNLVFKDFALALYSRDIGAVTFQAGLSKDDIHAFCRILTRDTFEIREAGGIRQVLQDASISHIRAQPIDFSGLHLTEEQEILGAKKQANPELHTHIWRSFLTHLLSGQLDSQGQLEHLANQQRTNPSHIAQLLNSGILNLRSAIESYETTIVKYVRDTTGHQPLESFIALLQDLNPRLRSQFLSVTFDQMAAQGDEALLSCFPDDVVVEMLQQASDEGKEISPTLITLLEKIAQIEIAQSPGRSPEKPPASSGLDPADRLSREKVKNLLQRESYETYVDSDYRSLLKNLITLGEVHTLDAQGGPGSIPPSRGVQRQPGVTRPEGSGISGCHAAVSEEELDARLTQMMVALMDKAEDPGDYLVFSRRIMASVPDHLSRGEIDLVQESLHIFRNHAREKPHATAQLAKDALLAFRSPEIVSAAVSALDACPEDDREQALSLVAELGEPCIPELIRAYADQEYPSSKAALFELLASFGQSTMEEIVRQLHHPSDHFLRNLLLLVQRIGNAGCAEAVRGLLSHPNLQVRWEAVTTLLAIQDPEAPLYLRRAIQSNDPDESLRAINLAGYYRVTKTAEDLACRIRTSFIGKSTHRANEEIIRALGRIGDARVLPHLERVAGKSWSFSPRRLRHLKLNLFESIGDYPRESLDGLVEIGKRSRDPRIQRICDRLNA